MTPEDFINLAMGGFACIVLAVCAFILTIEVREVRRRRRDG